MKRKLLLTGLLLALCTNISYADTYVKNDLRTKFLNNEAVIYEINIRTFSAFDKNGNDIIEFEKGDTSGNFINAIVRLDELKDYGINAIHLMPVNPVGKLKALGTAGSVYGMTEIAGIEPSIVDSSSKLTDKQQLKKFISEAHKRGIRVFIDLPACGSYDYSLKNPELFLFDKKGEPVIPVDWTDVRLFKTVEKDGSLNRKLVDEHKKYIDMIIEAGADGIRADVAPIKPQEFWEEIIQYARSKDPEFMFLAEVAEAWAPPKVPSPTANHIKLLEAGYDGYYGNCLNFLNFKSPKEFAKIFAVIEKFAKKGEKKTIIGCFDTHDLKSAYVTSKNYAESIMYMNATLPVNPYYVDGFQSGDKYDYKFSGKIADKTYTDSNIYYTHKNQLDIFNFSRKPGGDLPEMKGKLKESLSYRKSLGDIVTKGSFNMVKTTNKKVFAYNRELNGEGVIVLVNTNQQNAETAKIKSLKKLLNGKQIVVRGNAKVENNEISANLDKGFYAVIRYNIAK